MSPSNRLTTATIYLGRLTANLGLLRQLAGKAAVWPVIKCNAYGHGAIAVGRHLERVGCGTLCVADVSEAAALREAGVRSVLVTLSPALPEHAEALVAHGCEPVICDREMAEVLDRQAQRQQRRVAVHVKVDTGMGRAGIKPSELLALLGHCEKLPSLDVRGVMSHFASADETDKSGAEAQLMAFRSAIETAGIRGRAGRKLYHMANSAGLMDVPGAALDAVRPGIALYGLHPSREIGNPAVETLQPVLELGSRIVQIQEVAAGTPLSYGHEFRTTRPSRIATIPIGYGDGLRRGLSNRMEMIVGGVRCPQVGRITMDLSLVDVTDAPKSVRLGDEAVVIGSRGAVSITVDELARTLGTINYEIVCGISDRVHRVVVEGNWPEAEKAGGGSAN